MLKTSHLLLSAVLAASAILPARSNAQTGGGVAGAVFVMTNAADKNEIVAYKRGTDGSLAQVQSFRTGGRGSGGVTDPLGSQGSLTLSRDHSLLFAVNAGSGDISMFRVEGVHLFLLDKVPCGGSEPVAVAQYGNLVYVVNAGGASSVVGFTLRGGRLRPIPNSLAYLSAGSSGPGSLSFSPEKTTNNIDAFHVQTDGTLAPIVVNPSAGPGLFSLLFAPNGLLLATETGPAGGTDAGATSSYWVQPNGTLTAVSVSVPTLGAATCWNVVTPDGRFVYTSNAVTSTISGFAVGNTGTLTALSGTIVGTNPSGSTNVDIALSSDGKFLYTLNSGTGTVSIFGINGDGILTSLGDAGGLSSSAGYNGIAAI
jgi:6-phosphogluconolactonase (cycloisomerase 2 family)